MASIWACALSPSSYVAAGRSVVVPALRCPTCLVWLLRWGGYWRWLRAPLLIERIWIRRGRCAACRRTHALLPDLVSPRRLDGVGVIGHGIVLKMMAGFGLRPIAEQLDVPHTTVRTWWHRFRARSPTTLAQCNALAVALDGTPVMLTTNGERAALDALQVAWQRAQIRFGEAVGDLWRFWSRISGGEALGTNTTSPWARGSGADWMAASHFRRCTSLSAQSAEVIALFRYRIIGDATSARLGPAERGRIVRELARRVYEHPDGSQRQYTRGTLHRWIRAYRDQRLSGLKPEPTLRGIIAEKFLKRGEPYVVLVADACDEHGKMQCRAGRGLILRSDVRGLVGRHAARPDTRIVTGTITGGITTAERASRSLDIGAAIPAIRKDITLDQMCVFSFGAPNIHTDPVIASESGLSAPIAQGLMSTAYLSQMLTEFFGADWFESGRTSHAFIKPVSPGETLSVHGRIQHKNVETDGTRLGLEVWCRNQAGDLTTVGSASALIRG